MHFVALILTMMVFGCSALPEADGNCCFMKEGDYCECSNVFSCNIPPAFFGNDNKYLPPCVDAECNKNCTFSGLLTYDKHVYS